MAGVQEKAKTELGKLKKDELVEVVVRHARRLKRDELLALAERLEAKTLKLGDLVPSGDGGFGFQQADESADGSG